MSNHVIIKGKKDRLIVSLDPEIDFLELSEALKSKILEAKNFIGNSRLAIEFAGRPLTNEQENILIGIITSNSDITIGYIFSERLEDPNGETLLEIPKALVEEGKTYFHRGTLRSGASIDYDGNVVVIGDVNPATIIRAKGNVIVIGHLNGNVFAGLGGDENAFVGALFFNPVQVTIGTKTVNDIQSEILDSNRVDKKSKFKFAHIKNQEIVIEEWI